MNSGTPEAVKTVAREESGPREIASEQLLGPARQIRICHRGEWYTLRRTANDKLILTK
ncbi:MULTISPECIES: hemin uptake protein HemP [unclassified Thioalkalivibrio]|uniref:hemin uptake protein HemP n=1 Tax=unclassified Thioalkalivibrio TaxID=2621013 RepID=UPI00035F2091|nr:MULTISPECIES: hemin uptake protein HemP [unclassified Thioalkalivibrio]